MADEMTDDIDAISVPDACERIMRHGGAYVLWGGADRPTDYSDELQIIVARYVADVAARRGMGAGDAFDSLAADLRRAATSASRDTMTEHTSPRRRAPGAIAHAYTPPADVAGGFSVATYEGIRMTTLLTPADLSDYERLLYDGASGPERPLNAINWGHIITRPEAGRPAALWHIPEDVAAGYCYPLCDGPHWGHDGVYAPDYYPSLTADGALETHVMGALSQLT